MTSSITSNLPTLGWSALLVALGGFLYWLIQKWIDARFSKALEDYRHTNSLILQNEKLRLDLYDRRFEIFTSIFDYYEAMISWTATEEQKAARTRFFRAYQESGFLFTRESGIEALLKMLNDEGLKVIGFKENIEQYKSDPKFLIEQFNKTNEIQLKVFNDGFARLKTAMHQYLDFSKI